MSAPASSLRADNPGAARVRVDGAGPVGRDRPGHLLGGRRGIHERVGVRRGVELDPGHIGETRSRRQRFVEHHAAVDLCGSYRRFVPAAGLLMTVGAVVQIVGGL